MKGHSILAARRRRLAAISSVIGCAADVPSRLALLGAYLSTLRSTTSKIETNVRLRIKSVECPVRMRQSDVFVLEDVLLQGQYALHSTIGSAPTIVDAGANIGIAALWFLASYPDATLHCFEPEPMNCSFLWSNVGSLDRVSIEQRALGAQTVRATLNLSSHGAMHSLMAPAADPRGEVPVECLRLEDYVVVKGIDRVDLLKLDVEGSELDVLKGLGDRLDSVQVIVGEMHETVVDETTFYRFLADRGFHLVRKQHYGSDAGDGVHGFEVAR